MDERIRYQSVAEVAFVETQAVGHRQHRIVSDEKLLFQQRFVGTGRRCVHRPFQRIDVLLQFIDILRLAVRKEVGIGAAHRKTVHRDFLLLHVEPVVPQCTFVEPLAVAGLFVGLAVVRDHVQITFVVGRADVTRIGDDGVHIAVDGAVVVNQHVVQQIGAGIPSFDTDGHILDTVEKEPVLEFECRFCCRMSKMMLNIFRLA